MTTVDDLYDAIEAGDRATLAQVLALRPELVEGAGATPPPLHWAIYHDQVSMVEGLLEGGADIERQDQDRQATPLAYSIVFGRTNIARHLLEAGANTRGMRDLALRGAAGEFHQYPDVATADQFASIAKLFARD